MNLLCVLARLLVLVVSVMSVLYPRVAGPAHTLPGARGVRDAGVCAQLPGSVALRRADTLRGLLHADRRGYQVSNVVITAPKGHRHDGVVGIYLFVKLCHRNCINNTRWQR